MLELKYIPLTQAMAWQWQQNPKKHDLPKIKAALTRYGFQDPPKFDAAIPSAAGDGGIIGGNGRLEALQELCAEKSAPPNGITVDEQGAWLVPILFGNDLANQTEAEAFAVDANNLTLAGAGLSAVEVAVIYDRKRYDTLLGNLQEANALPVSLDGDSLSLLLADMDSESAQKEWGYGADDLAKVNKKVIADDIEEADTTAIIGPNFVFKVERAVYFEWLENLRQEVGFSEKAIKQEILRRIGLALTPAPLPEGEGTKSPLLLGEG